MEILGIFLLCALGSDLKTRRIPNRLLGVMLVTVMMSRLFQEGMKGLIRATLIMLLIVAVMSPFFLKGMIGAGDIKLLAVVTAGLKSDEILNFWFCSFAAALVMALLLRIIKKDQKDCDIPMAVPIFAAFLIMLGGK